MSDQVRADSSPTQVEHCNMGRNSAKSDSGIKTGFNKMQTANITPGSVHGAVPLGELSNHVYVLQLLETHASSVRHAMKLLLTDPQHRQIYQDRQPKMR